ncbi:MAG: clostripain-related cysteine peptidase [Defluviitaleaceae bacterium]|nr:clostripain-related cysteine peptidase [Defluviitaleaceae bacterium]
MKIRSLIIVCALLLASGSGSNTTEIATTAKPHTIMIYMNGSDLESEIGAATTDLIEMLESGLNSQNANVVIFTGGTKYWQNDVIPANECAMWKIEDGEIFEIKRVGLLNMGDPDTLADFINFSIANFPAEKYGLILWDHGGGAIAGFGHDEKFDYYDEGSLTLAEMDYAFNKAGLSGQKLEWLGFDSCLMATVEMAIVSAQYARYLVASEDLEPGDGWDYKFLALLNQNPQACGYILGKEIVDTFIDFYGPDSDEILTLSVVDLNKVQQIMDAMGQLMEQCSDKLLNDLFVTDKDDAKNFTILAQRRKHTKTFGLGSPRDNESDMVDIGDMAHQLADLFPHEASTILDALNEAVLYNRHNSRVPLYGLSAYYVYGGPFYESMDLYAGLDVGESYTQYLLKFFEQLTNRQDIRDMLDVDIPLLRYVMGQPVALYRTAQLAGRTQYAIPARVNGKDCDIVVCLKDDCRKLKVLGFRHDDGLVKQKGYDIFEPGDKISFYRPSQGFYSGRRNDCEWLLGEEIEI